MKNLVTLSPVSRPTLWPFLLAGLLLILFSVEPAFAQEVAKRPAPPPRPLLFTQLFFERLGINTISMFILVVLVYLPIHRKKEFFFLFFILNFLVFIIMYLMLKMSTFEFGAGLGLVAFFSLLRLRTDLISMKDMTYLFVVLTIGLVNAVMTGPYYELITLNATMIALTFGLDKEWLSKSIHMRELQVDSLDNIMPQQTDKLIADLRVRTGLEIQRVHVESVDLVKKRAVLKVYYY